MKETIFCKHWSRSDKSPYEVWTPEQARKAHEDRSPYTAVIPGDVYPKCFIDIANGFFIVYFLDKLAREHLVYQFKEVEPGKLFLNSAIHRDYIDDTLEILEASIYHFRQDGLINISKNYFSTNNVETSNTKGEVSSNY